MKKTLIVLMILSFLVLTSACLTRDKTAEITLYYTNESNSEILTEKRTVKISKDKTLPQLAVEELLKGPETNGLKSTIPEGTKLLNLNVKDKIATVNLSEDFTGFPGTMAESLAIISIVNTLTDLEGIEQVQILVDGNELIAPSGNPYGLLKRYNVEQINKDLNKHFVTLYFPDDQARYVVPEQREITDDEPIAETIVKELMKGPKTPGLAPTTIPKEAKLLSVEIKDKIAYVNFSRELIEKHTGGSTGEMMTILPIVNSLTELPEIEKVQFLVEGQKEKTLAGHIAFDEPFERNEDYIKKSVN
ncbi:MAG TPA: GerMN domain-containing protein [Thermoanaerobacterales bacterium]|nr:GerMN domain-containing protein [Thermoanaerobacterales bacterium]